MEINIVFRIAAVGILVAVLHQVLMRAGDADHAGRVGCGAVLGDSIHQPAV